MSENVILFDSWTAPDTKELIGSYLEKGEDKVGSKKRYVQWRQFGNELSPMEVYKYLKARFGLPNGITVIVKNPSLDNIIHWHYSIVCKTARIEFYGHSSGLEIMINDTDSEQVEPDRKNFVDLLKKDFAKYKAKMKEMQSGFEHWVLFTNPYVRLYKTIHDLIDEMESIDLSETKELSADSNSDDQAIHHMSLETWIKNVNRSTLLGTTLRMLFPVLIESFINLLLFVLRKKEFRDDGRIYENLLRQQIDIRVKTLHLNCDGFTSAVDGADFRFKAFHSLMNRRNDYLHGNIDPNKLQVENLYIDERHTPLFEYDEGIIRKMMRKSNIGVSLSDVLNDEKVTYDFIEMVLEKLDSQSFKVFILLMGEQFPGFNKSTEAIAAIMPPAYVEGMAFSDREIEADSDYTLFVEDRGGFKLYIPVNWKHWKDGATHYFKPYELYKHELLILSVSVMQEFQILRRKQRFARFPIKKLGALSVIQLPPRRLGETINNAYLFFVDNAQIHFTFTYPDALDKDLDQRKLTDLVKQAEKVISSFKLIAKEEMLEVVKSYRFESFMKGIATSQLLLNNAMEAKSFFEVLVILTAQIEALLRMSIVLKLQILNGDKEFDDRWFFQEKTRKTITLEDITEEAMRLEIIDESLSTEIRNCKSQSTHLSENFITSPIALPELEAVAYESYETSKKVSDIVFELEAQQVKLGVGMTVAGADRKEAGYADLTKSRVAKQPYFENKILRTIHEIKKDRNS